MTTMENAVAPPNRFLGIFSSWVMVLSVFLGCLLACLFLVIAIPIFGAMFTGLGVEPPFLTKFLITNYFWFCPVLSVGIIVLLVRAFLIRKAHRLRAAGIAMLAAVASLALVIVTLYLPVLTFAYRLGQTK
jgi:hypothetical protein